MSIKKRLTEALLKFVPTKKTIIFESVPFMSDNTRYVYEELVRRGYNRKYKMIWMQWDNNDCLLPTHNVKMVNPKKNKIIWRYYLATATCLICCNRFVGKIKKNQTCIYLMHGTPIKSLKSNKGVPSYFDYMVTAGKGVNDICAMEFKFDVKRTIPLGFPRNDLLGVKPTIDLKELFGSFEKYVIWYPTFRQNKSGTIRGNTNALPLIHNLKTAEMINDYAGQERILVIVKPHFAQDLNYIKQKNLSNIVFIDDGFFVRNGLSSYELVNACDSLITDYSSIYFDYTLCDKPVAVIWEDIKEYEENPGFCLNLERFLCGAEKIYNVDDFLEYLKRIADGIDVLKEKRRKIQTYCNYSTDHQNSKRVVDFIIDKAGL